MREQLRALLLSVLGEPGAAETFARGRDREWLAGRQAAVLARKPGLRRELARRDAAITAALERWATAAGPVIEVGAGLSPYGGADSMPTDIYAGAAVRMLASAQDLPIAGGSLRALVGVHAFHHLSQPQAFLGEAVRVLKPGGCLVLVEPNFNRFSQLVFGRFHPERFDVAQAAWETRIEDDTDANQALSWLVFFRDAARFERGFRELELVETSPVPSLSFVLAGGFLLRPLAPAGVIGAVARATARQPLRGALAVHRLIVLRRR